MDELFSSQITAKALLSSTAQPKWYQIKASASFCLFQAAELAEFTAKIALLEEAKKKKEEEASEWQHKVMSSCCVKSELQRN